jgi:xanthine dehydrogenase accessory factor
MNEIEYLAQIICEQLERQAPLVLVSLVSQQGSTPRHGSTKMVVGADGQSYGTIGGSLLEATAIKESQIALSITQSRTITFELSGKDATAAGMICGGKAEVLLDFIPATKDNLEFFWSWKDTIKQGQEFYLLTHYKGSGNALEVLSHTILFSNGLLIGNTSLNNQDVEKIQAELLNILDTAVISLENTRLMIDPIRKVKTLYCFGAGHVAVPTSHIAALVGFRVVVVDDRAEFADAERFPDASQTLVIKDFSRALEGLEIDADSFIVIVTRGHQYDRAVLEQSLKTNAGYIGMISSRRKRDAIYEYLMNQGVEKEQLERVHSPIGINIAAETPAEIAVSIVAELIKERNKPQI